MGTNHEYSQNRNQPVFYGYKASLKIIFQSNVSILR